MNRWSKNGVLDRIFEQLQREQIVRITITAVKLDSTIVKVHPDGMGALKKTAQRTGAGSMELQALARRNFALKLEILLEKADYSRGAPVSNIGVSRLATDRCNHSESILS